MDHVSTEWCCVIKSGFSPLKIVIPIKYGDVSSRPGKCWHGDFVRIHCLFGMKCENVAFLINFAKYCLVEKSERLPYGSI